MTEPAVVDLGYVPRRWQREAHVARQQHRFVVLAVHRRAGKTLLGLMELLDAALRSTQPLALYAYVAPFLKQAKSIAWAELKKRIELLRSSRAVEVNEAELTVTFLHNGATVRLFGADNADGLRGVGLDGLVLDEVAWIRPETWTDVLQPTLSDRLGWTLFIGTPCGVNLFSELFQKASELPGWCALRFTVDDTEALDPEEVKRLQRDMPAAAYRREMLCDFSAAADDQLIPLSLVEEASHRSYPANVTDGAPRIVGVDPARFGDDRSVIVQRHGVVMLPPLIYTGIDNMDLAARVAGVVERWQPDATFVDSGAGAGVIDRLRQLGFNPLEVPFGGKANKPLQFVNRRSEMWWLLREWLKEGGSIPNDPALRQELATPTYSFDAAGRKLLESKDDIKKRLPGAGSPDIADALALTFANPIMRSWHTELDDLIARQREARPRSEDPLQHRLDRNRDPFARR